MWDFILPRPNGFESSDMIPVRVGTQRALRMMRWSPWGQLRAIVYYPLGEIAA